MMMPTGVWLTITSYRDFYDFPRLILAADQESRFWILDSDFDDEQDEYTTNYNVYFVGHELEQASVTFKLHADGNKGSVVGVIHNTQLEFDPTKRQSVRLINERP